ncbi:NYN domain-containing protein [Nocardia ninae]|uniref:NYN domain-containing protein n=1 Tax=Nocardia ninae NBRC 108245 TaxID=1210091 RepID=A0A511MC96_9NOCA|nr:NYN domain-containing protein [Nocardia ninae]GEM38250.1 hypothetical protein NN4_27690 [Nocardia ninae NBRC 108245]
MAVLIDADNVAPGKIGAVLTAVAAEHGGVGIRRAYGDWDRPHLSGWRPAVLAHSIRRIDAIAFSPRKQCTDHAMVADAIHLALMTDLSVIVLVTSDGDFTDLAMRLREYGLRVEGFGKQNTPAPFVRACDRFTVLDDLTGHPRPEPAAAPGQPAPDTTKKATKNGRAKAPAKSSTASTGLAPEVADSLRAMVDKIADKEGLANLATACHRLNQQRDLKAKLNGHLSGKTGRFLKRCGLFDVIERPGKNGTPTTYLRSKSRSA